MLSIYLLHSVSIPEEASSKNLYLYVKKNGSECAVGSPILKQIGFNGSIAVFL